MKKWALPLSLALAVSSVVPAFAATDPVATNFRGHFKSQLQYNSSDVNKENPDLNMITGAFGAVDVDVRGDIVLSPNAQNRFVLELRGRVRGDKFLDEFPTRIGSADSSHAGRFGKGFSGNIFGTDWNTSELIDKAFLENKSAWWADGPTITTRIGRQDPNYNPWVGKISRFDRTGVTVEGLALGPVNVRLGYIWGGGREPDASRQALLQSIPVTAKDSIPLVYNIQSLVVNASVPVESANLDLSAVRTNAGGLDKAVFDYGVGLTVPLTDAFTLTGNYARDGYNEKNAYRVELATQLGAANLSALYRAVDTGYAPIYEDRDDFMNPEKRTESRVHDERTGFKIAASGQVHNWNLSGSFDSSYREWLGRTSDEKIDTIELGASTKFSTVDFWASAKLEKSKEDDSVAKWVQEGVRDGARYYKVGAKKDKNEYKVGLGTNFDIVRATYEFKHTDEKDKDKKTDHTIALAAPLKVAYLDTIHVGGSVVLRDSDRKTGYGVDLAWVGQNGIRVGVHYTGGFNGARHEGYYDEPGGSLVDGSEKIDPDELRKYTYPDGTVHYLGNGLAVTAGWGITF